MLDWDDDLRLAGTSPAVYLDGKKPRGLSFVSHAHSDHLAEHQRAFLTPATAALAERRVAIIESHTIDFRQPFSPYALLDGSRGAPQDDAREHARDISCRFLPAGHVLGSAMLHVQGDAGSLLYTGDFKLRSGLTVEPTAGRADFDALETDWLVMESTYGLPHFRFPSREHVADELVTRCAEAIRAGRQPIVLGYSLGKAQEGTRILSDAGIPVTQHGAAWHLTQIYEKLGTRISTNAPVRKYDFADFHGDRALSLEERGVLVAPPHVTRTSFVSRFENPLRIVLTGWAILKNAHFRYGVDVALPLSDHADFDELIELVERVSPRKGVYTHHGYPAFADHLRSRGINAKLARPDAQLSLFGE